MCYQILMDSVIFDLGFENGLISWKKIYKNLSYELDCDLREGCIKCQHWLLHQTFQILLTIFLAQTQADTHRNADCN